MSFEEDLKAVIKRSNDARAKYESEGRDFDQQWTQLRQKEGLLRSTLEHAAKILRDEHFDATAEPENGSSFVLRVIYNGTDKLTFKADKKERVVLCSSTKDGTERFELSSLTEDAIQDKVKEFVDLVIRGKAPHLP